MTTVELVYDLDCPNVAKARANLMKALAASGWETRWTEWDRSAPESPSYVKGYGSPTILIQGRDVAGAVPGNGCPSCRLYRNEADQLDGAPSVKQITEALLAGEFLPPVAARRPSGWKSSLAALSGVGAALLPVGVCPACWPAYAGLLSALGFGFLLDTAYLLPFTAVFLLLAVGALAFRARMRRGYGPFIAGLAASTIVLTGKFTLASNAAMYGGIALLVVASVWNVWPRKAADVGSGACPACAPEGQALHSQEPGAKEVPS